MCKTNKNASAQKVLFFKIDYHQLRKYNEMKIESSRNRGNLLKPVRVGRLVFDNFRKKGLLHLLSHAHSDHTNGLTNKWMHAPILCTEITAKIIMTRFPQIPEALFVIKALGDHVKLDDVEIQITDANHCPGSAMFIYNSQRDGKKIVFTGDFRLNDAIRDDIDLFQNADLMYLDCTFNKPIFQFPSQYEAISEVINIIGEKSEQEIHLGVYSIGKNKIIQAISEHFQTQIYTPPNLYKVYAAIGMEKFVTTNKNDAWIHSYPRHFIEKRHHKSDGIVKISPTGWAKIFRSNPDKNLYYVPYSEHNDYNLLHEFVSLTKPKKIIPICGNWNPELIPKISDQNSSYQSTLF